MKKKLESTIVVFSITPVQPQYAIVPKRQDYVILWLSCVVSRQCRLDSSTLESASIQAPPVKTAYLVLAAGSAQCCLLIFTSSTALYLLWLLCADLTKYVRTGNFDDAKPLTECVS